MTVSTEQNQPGAEADPKISKPKPPGENEGDAGSDPDASADAGDASGWDEKTKTYIQGLRKESAKYRSEAKEAKTKLTGLEERLGKLEGGLKNALGLEDDTVDPESKIRELTAASEALQFETSVKDIAIDHGLRGKESVKYLKFLIAEKASEMEDGDDLTDEDLSAIIAQVKKVHGGASSTSTSVNTSSMGSADPAPGGPGLTPEKFAKMSITEKSTLYGKDPTSYAQLFRDAKEKKLI